MLTYITYCPHRIHSDFRMHSHDVDVESYHINKSLKHHMVHICTSPTYYVPQYTVTITDYRIRHVESQVDVIPSTG